MNDEILISKEEFANLNERIKKLAIEKSYLELFTHLMEKISSVSGLENTISNLLQILLENLGGSNIIIYYPIDNKIFYADVLGKKESINEIDDDIIKKVFDTKTSVEQQSSFDDTKLLSSGFTKANVWAFPLQVGSEIIAVIKIESLYVTTGDLRFHLPIFFSFAAHILKNEILGHTRLKAAYEELSKENNLRKLAEAELRAINEELGDIVDARTIELQNVNTQLKEELEVRKQTESQIRKLNRIYAVLSNINQAIVRIHNTKDIFDEACRIAVEYGKFKMVWIGIINSQTNKVDVVASSGVQYTYLENLDIDLSDEQRSSGPTGIAIRTGIHKISNNIIDDDSMLLWRNDAVKFGYKSTASFPLIVFNKVVGSFCIYSDEADFFEEEDVVLLDEMAKDISFAMEFIESETERRDAEEALLRSEERFRRLAENAPDVIYRMSLLDGKYEYISPAAITIFGYSPEDYYSNPLLFKQSVHPDWHKYFDEQWSELLKGKIPPMYEYQIIHKSGEPRWLNQRNILVHDESGNSIAIEGIVTDITERKQAEQTLHQASEEIRDLYNHAPCGYHSLDKDGVFVRINNTELEWLGYTREEVLGKMKFTDIITAKSLETFKEYFSVFKERGWVKDLEFELIRKDGTVLPILVSSTAIKESSGKYLMSRSTVYDITERKISELQLRNSEREFRTLAENIPDNIIRYDLDCRVIYLNHVVAATNYTNSSLVGKLSAEIRFNEAEGIEEYNEKLRRIIKTGVEDEMELILRDIEGNLHIHEVHFLAEHDTNGNITGALAIGRDITERKLAEKERQAHLRFFENMDKINRAIQEANNVEQMMSDVLDIILFTFDCDRASFIYPCDVEASFWKVPIERTKPEHPGAQILGVEIPVDSEAVRVFSVVLAANNPVGFGAGNEEALPQPVSDSFNIKSQLAISLHPKIGKQWMFVLHQCSSSRSWTSEEKKLLKEISTRLTDGLTSLLTLSNLLESERRLTEAQRIANVGYWERDFVNNKIILSDESCRIFGLHQENYQKKLDEWHRQWLQLILPEDKERAEKAVIDAVQNDIPYNLDYRIIRHNGELRYIHSEANVRKDSYGKPVFMLGMMQDITERKRAEESLRESETKLRVMFENSRDAIGVSKKGVLVFANPAYLKLFGYEKLEELLGTSILNCIAPSHHQQIIQNVQRRVSGENAPSFYETRGRKRDGSEFDFEINVSTYELNSEIYTLANIRDITSRKLLEKALFFVAERGWQSGEENFFDSLAQFLGENLDMDYVVVDKICDDPDIAETIALYAKGEIVPNIRYALKGTPCENVMGRQLCFYPKEAQKLFPEDGLLVEMGVESYIGIPLWDSFGKPIGLIALMSNKPHPEDTTAIQVLQLVATRAAAELERERSDRILRKREYEFRTLAESLPDNIVRYNLEGRTIYVNPVLEKTLATGAADMIGTTIRELHHDGSYESYAQAVDNALASGENSELEIQVPNTGNEQIVHQIRIIVERDEQNKVTGILAIGRDITERKRAEEALYKERNLLRTVIDNLPDGIWTKDLNCRKTLANLANVYMSGLKSENEILGKDDYELFPEEFAERFMMDDRSVIETGKPVINREEYVVSKNGQKHFLLTTKLPFIDEKGRMIGLIGISRDITERKQAEAALNERVKHSQSLLRLSKNLELAQTYSQVLNAALDEVRIILGYQSLWVYLLSEDKKYFKAIAAGGDVADVVMSPEGTATLAIAGDRMLEEIAEAKEIVIVEDARTDERTNKKMVEVLGNRTIINVPIYLFNKHLGTVGTGTFDSEGVRIPTHSEQDYLLAMGSHLAVTLDRIHLLNEREKTEHALLRLNRELKAISNCNQSLLRAEDEQSLLNEICNLICNEAGYKFAWVGYAENDIAKTIRPVAWAGINSEYIAGTKLSWSDETEHGRGPAGITIRTGEIVCVSDFESDQMMAPWRESALLHGYRSGISLPLKDMNTLPFGALLIYSSEQFVFTPDEIRLLDELANDLAFGIITIRTRAERKRVEKELELHRDHLQELINVRTEELNKANKKLIIEFEKEKEFERMLQHSLEKEKELSELKSRFISTTSHEFRTPLTTVRVSAEMIQRYRKRWSDEKLDEYMEKIKKSVDYLTKLLDDVLTISRSESGKIILNKQKIDLYAFCLEVIDEAKLSATEAHKLIFHFTLKKNQYSLDPKLMKFILLNLLSKAIKYSPDGGKVELNLKPARNKIVISVKDQGIGIPADDLKHLFEPFHRAKNTTDISGTGLGLSIVKRAVDLHNGIITVKSTLGKGTAFTVKIPLEK